VSENQPTDTSARTAPAKKSIFRRVGAIRAFYTRRQLGVMLLAVLIGAGAILHANHLLSVSDPPPASTEPVLSLVLDPAQSLGWSGQTEYQVQESFSRCRNPLTVELDAFINSPSEAFEPSTATSGFADGSLNDPLAAAAKLTLWANPSGTIPPSWVPAGRELTPTPNRKYVVFGGPLREWYPSSVVRGMATASAQRAPLAMVRFHANWVLPRSSGTCFVRFPTLQAPIVDPANPPSTASQYAPHPGPGEVNLISSSGEIVSLQSSIPPPTDPRIPQWRCASMAISIAAANADPATGGASNCGGVAVFSVPGTDSRVALWLLIDGALIGVAAALFVDPAIRFQRPRQTASETSGDRART
jgi:hypothetical protein